VSQCRSRPGPHQHFFLQRFMACWAWNPKDGTTCCTSRRRFLPHGSRCISNMSALARAWSISSGIRRTDISLWICEMQARCFISAGPRPEPVMVGLLPPRSRAISCQATRTWAYLKIALTRRVPSNFKTMSASHFENFYTRQLADPMYSGSVGGGMVTVVRHFPRSLECCGADGSKAVALCFLRIGHWRRLSEA
jgi:hypothetical protein